MAYVMTVLGPVDAEQVGVTLMHEHVFCDTTARFAPVDDEAPLGLTPLAAAASQGRAGIVQELLDHGADPNRATSRDGRPPLLHAATAGKWRAARVLLDRPIGRLSRFLPADASISLAHRAAPALWAWLSLQLPGIIASLDVHGIVERKVLGFSTQRMEELVRNVTQKELNLIVNLGYVLGAVIGVVTWVVGRMVG